MRVLEDLAREVARGTWSVLRSVLFIAGALWGWLMASGIANLGGGGAPRVLAYAWIYGTLALGIAAPVCWYFVIRAKAGDRRTAAYVAAWAVYFGVGHLAVFLNDLFGPSRGTAGDTWP